MADGREGCSESEVPGLLRPNRGIQLLPTRKTSSYPLVRSRGGGGAQVEGHLTVGCKPFRGEGEGRLVPGRSSPESFSQPPPRSSSCPCRWPSPTPIILPLGSPIRLRKYSSQGLNRREGYTWDSSPTSTWPLD